MSNALALRSCEASPAAATVADLMPPPLTTIEHSAHVGRSGDT